MREREITQSFRVDETELAQLHALAKASDEPIGRLLRRWIAERYTARFGDATPPQPEMARTGRPVIRLKGAAR